MSAASEYSERKAPYHALTSRARLANTASRCLATSRIEESASTPMRARSGYLRRKASEWPPSPSVRSIMNASPGGRNQERQHLLQQDRSMDDHSAILPPSSSAASLNFASFSWR